MSIEEEAMIKRHEKVERLRMAWQKNMEHFQKITSSSILKI